MEKRYDRHNSPKIVYQPSVLTLQQNGVLEALWVFKCLLEQDPDRRKCVVLIMTQVDLFRRKLVSDPINSHFPEFQGHTSGVRGYRQGLKFFAEKFLAHANGMRGVHLHCTNACDTALTKGCLEQILAHSRQRIRDLAGSPCLADLAQRMGCCDMSYFRPVLNKDPATLVDLA